MTNATVLKDVERRFCGGVGGEILLKTSQEGMDVRLARLRPKHLIAFWMLLGVFVTVLSGGCVAPQKTDGRPLAYVIRSPLALDGPVRCDGCWAQLSVLEEDGYFLFFSPTRPAPKVVTYLTQLEGGSGCGVLRNADVYVGSQLNVPLILFGCHSWADLAFSGGGL